MPTTLETPAPAPAKPEPETKPGFIKWAADTAIEDVPLVGGKNASLGEMYRALAAKGVRVSNGFSVGSNDLTQLILGVDRDSEIVAPIFDERNAAVKTMIAQVIKTCREKGRKIGICGQAPSDYPEFAQFLVEQGIDSI